ncbi:MAG: ribonuclease HII [Bacteroidales bacterium]|nr:ribonuclease HII [Bacteroidales bacterium]
MLKASFSNKRIEAGCDEAGRGCLAGPVFAGAVILPLDFQNEILNDSKKLNERNRDELRLLIEEQALAWAVASVDHKTIDQINILNASYLAMHIAVRELKIRPELLLIDGNRFKAFEDIEHKCIIKGDGIYASIAAASILAKTHRDEYMARIHKEFPDYGWNQNKGYPTPKHKQIVLAIGHSPYHRLTFKVQSQLKLEL